MVGVAKGTGLTVYFDTKDELVAGLQARYTAVLVDVCLCAGRW